MALLNNSAYNLDIIDNFQNHLLVSEIFLLAFPVISLINFILATDKLTRKILASKVTDYDPNKYKWFHITSVFFHFILY